MVDRINRLINEIQRVPFAVIGKPEPLRGNLTGWWSRRLTGEHRFVYRVVGAGETQRLEIISCRFHYSRRPWPIRPPHATARPRESTKPWPPDPARASTPSTIPRRLSSTPS